MNILLYILEAKFNKCGCRYNVPCPLHFPRPGQHQLQLHDFMALVIGSCAHSSQGEGHKILTTLTPSAEHPSMVPHCPQNNFQTFQHGSNVSWWWGPCQPLWEAKSLSPVRLFATPMDGSPPGPSVHGIFQARTLEWIPTSSSNLFRYTSYHYSPFSADHDEEVQPIWAVCLRVAMLFPHLLDFSTCPCFSWRTPTSPPRPLLALTTAEARSLDSCDVQPCVLLVQIRPCHLKSDLSAASTS